MTDPVRVKRQVPGGWIFRAATGDWTYRLDGELFWRMVALTSEQAALDALNAEVVALLDNAD